MAIYTKTGDKGQTQIYAENVQRMSKDAPVVECYGTLDELNAHVGLLAAQLNQYQLTRYHETLNFIQQRLFQIGFAISASTKLTEQDVLSLEAQIDEMETTLPAQTHFILPGGHLCASQAHVCRTVARRAERRLVALQENFPVPGICVQYLNRLSDYLFVMARHINHQCDILDVKVD